MSLRLTTSLGLSSAVPFCVTGGAACVDCDQARGPPSLSADHLTGCHHSLSRLHFFAPNVATEQGVNMEGFNMEMDKVGLRQTLRELESACEEAREHYLEKLAVCEELRRTLQAMEDVPMVVQNRSTRIGEMGSPVEEEAGKLDTPLGLSLSLDIGDAGNRVERIRVLAEHMPGNEFDLYEVAKWLIAAGYSDATYESLRSSIYGDLKKNEAMFVKDKTRPRIYRLVVPEDSGVVQFPQGQRECAVTQG